MSPNPTGPIRRRSTTGLRALRQGRIDEAIERYRAALAVEPGPRDRLERTSMALAKQGDAFEAAGGGGEAR
ncbi:MAG: hypothetical protein R3E53_15545 [Myxococcota bacterium]